MSILVVGSVAFDDIETPSGRVKNVIGGSAVYFSLSASYFSKVHVVAAIGEDFPQEFIHFMLKKGIDTAGIVRMKGKTFRWKGKYGDDLNTAYTLKTELNVFKEFSPEIPSNYKSAKVLFLANIDPVLQKHIIYQMKNPVLIICDTMNHWIKEKRKELMGVLKKINLIIINEMETKLLAEENNTIKAAKKILKFGPESVVVKRGEYGVMYIDKDRIISFPSFPVENVYDPTGAGDSFAGGFVGYISGVLGNSSKKIKNAGIIARALLYGGVMGSFCIEDFSIKRFERLSFKDIKKRYMDYKKIFSGYL